mmetsp:Transcript_16473/g.30154  ORF Transcript_16473/g.30154 Transcript_16473/m.30154 type:complete len:163 (-) Transcript_16473:37-525(-)
MADSDKFTEDLTADRRLEQATSRKPKELFALPGPRFPPPRHPLTELAHKHKSQSTSDLRTFPKKGTFQLKSAPYFLVRRLAYKVGALLLTPWIGRSSACGTMRGCDFPDVLDGTQRLELRPPRGTAPPRTKGADTATARTRCPATNDCGTRSGNTFARKVQC